jgi:pSer/pThr/pTyr-binding forkhead associated (FHA) protein
MTMLALRYSTPEGVKIHPLRETFTIGRDAQNDLALPDDPKVSHQHARIRQVGDTHVVEDLHSTNGTFLEREFEVTRITSPQQLRRNDVIRVGSTRLVFAEDVAADTPPPTPPAAEPAVPPLALEEPDVATQVLGETRVGRYLPVFLEPPEESAPAPHLAPPTLPGAARRIAELEQQLAELRAKLAQGSRTKSTTRP